MRVVFDTNVLISAWLSPQGKASQCIAAAEVGRITSLTCLPILSEFGQKLREKFNVSGVGAQLIVHRIRQISLVVQPDAEAVKGATADPNDDVVIACALAGGATHIVSGDKRHLLSMGSYDQITIIPPARLVELLERR